MWASISSTMVPTSYRCNEVTLIKTKPNQCNAQWNSVKYLAIIFIFSLSSMFSVISSFTCLQSSNCFNFSCYWQVTTVLSKIRSNIKLFPMYSLIIQQKCDNEAWIEELIRLIIGPYLSLSPFIVLTLSWVKMLLQFQV